jgi:hypothetical protein
LTGASAVGRKMPPMSEDQIAELVKSALSALKATDTFAWLTTDAVTSLNNRAQTKLALLTDFET